MVQPRLSNYCVLLKLNFPALLVPSEQWTFSHLLSGGKVPLASPFLWASRATIPKNWHLLHWSNIRQLPLGYQGSRRWLWYGVLWLLWVLSGWLLMINAIVDVYKTESFLRPTVKEAPASKPARLTGKREARWIQDDMQEWVKSRFSMRARVWRGLQIPMPLWEVWSHDSGWPVLPTCKYWAACASGQRGVLHKASS